MAGPRRQPTRHSGHQSPRHTSRRSASEHAESKPKMSSSRFESSPSYCGLQELQEELQSRQTQQVSLQALWSQLQPEEDGSEAQEKLHVTGSKLKLLLRKVGRDLSSLQQHPVRAEPATSRCPHMIFSQHSEVSSLTICLLNPGLRTSTCRCFSRGRQSKEGFLSTEVYRRLNAAPLSPTMLTFVLINTTLLCFGWFAVQREEGLLPSSRLLLPGVLCLLPADPPPPVFLAAPVSDCSNGEKLRLRWHQQLGLVLLPHVTLHQRSPTHLSYIFVMSLKLSTLLSLNILL